MELLRATLSQAGFDKAQGCMRTNEFLGQLVGGEKIMNEFSYNVSVDVLQPGASCGADSPSSNIFGNPSTTQPWGFNLYGHHLCLSVTYVGPQMVISPTFFGAEPDVIDEGKHRGLRLFKGEEVDGLRLMQSLNSNLQREAQLYSDVSLSAIPCTSR